jgi:hypothetical protein
MLNVQQMVALLQWRSVTPSNHPKFLVKGTELSAAIVPGTLSRFQICEVRTYDADGHADRQCVIRDAATVTDAQMREGKRSAIVKWFPDELAALEWCALQIKVAEYCN